MKALLDIAVLSAAFWAAIVKLLTLLPLPFAEPNEPVEMVITETISQEQLEEQEKANQAVQAVKDYTAKLQEQNHQLSDVAKELMTANEDKKELLEREQKLKAEVEKLKSVPLAPPKQPAPSANPVQSPTLPPNGPGPGKTTESKSGEPLHWNYSLEEAEQQAKELHRPLFIAFCMPDNECPFCVMVKRDVYEKAEVSSRLRTKFIPVWKCVGSSGDSDARRFNVNRYPACVVIQEDGTISQFHPEFTPKGFLAQLENLSKWQDSF